MRVWFVLVSLCGVAYGSCPPFFTAFPQPVAAAPVVHELADLDGDGDLDLVVGHAGGTFTLQFGEGDGGFLRAVVHGVGGVPAACAFLDLDGDQDVVVASEIPNRVERLLGDGAAGFGAAVLVATSFVHDLRIVDAGGTTTLSGTRFTLQCLFVDPGAAGFLSTAQTAGLSLVIGE